MPNTSCRECVFAMWSGSEQTGCRFDRIEKFANNGANIVIEEVDGAKHYLIEGRFCNACRDKNWGRENPRRKWKQLVEDRIKIQIDIIIRVGGKATLEDIVKTLRSSYAQTIQPQMVFVVCEPGYAGASILDIVTKVKGEAKGPWKLEQQPLENVFKYCKSTYYGVFNAGFEIPSNFIETLNEVLNVKMERFVALLPDENGNGLVVQQCGQTINQILKLAEDQNSRYLIRPFEAFHQVEESING